MTERTYWHKQTSGEPLYPDLLWSRPETMRQAGKLLVIGGNAHGFAAPAEAYAEAVKAGIGTARVLLPDSLQKTVGKVFEVGEYAPSTPSGSFARQALTELTDAASWADAVLLAGDFGHNSETAILLEKFVQDYKGILVFVQDAVDYFNPVSESILNRPDTLLVTEFAQLQKLSKNAEFTPAFTSDMDLLRLVENLYNFTERFGASVVIEHLSNIAVAVGEEVSTTKITDETTSVAMAAHAAVWWLQNPAQPFEAITTSVLPVGS